MKASILFNMKLNYDHVVNNIVSDSRIVEANDVFYAIKGTNYDGCDFVNEAINKGAKTIVLDSRVSNITEEQGVNYIYKDNVQVDLSDKLYLLNKYIFKKIKVITVTGTNGKTTTSTLLYRYLRSKEISVSLIGSNGNYVNDKYYKSNNTTDDIYTIYNLLKESYLENVKYFIMEASSHAIKLSRIRKIPIELAVFSNLSLDHLDFHTSLDDYKYTKLLHLKSAKEVILNTDDENYHLFTNYLTNYFTYGLKGDIQIDNQVLSSDYSKFNLIIDKESYFFKTNLLGSYNVQNIAAFIAVLVKLNLFEYGKVYTFLKQLSFIDGRMEVYTFNKIKFIIDFAHTPDGVKKVLEFLKSIKKNKLITVIGCGGSRDKLKREKIGEVSSNLSDVVIYTTDNPRDEDEEAIIDEIIKGVKKENYLKIISRKEAINKAIELASSDDIIAILGKGNEKYILKKKVRIPYNDKEYLFSIFNEVK